MKELLTAIIGKEEELKGRSEKAGKDAQSVVEAAKAKADTFSADYEKKFQDEKAKKTREVEDAVGKYEDGLKAKLAADLKNSGKKLDDKKESIKAGILKAMLEE